MYFLPLCFWARQMVCFQILFSAGKEISIVPKFSTSSFETSLLWTNKSFLTTGVIAAMIPIPWKIFKPSMVQVLWSTLSATNCKQERSPTSTWRVSPCTTAADAWNFFYFKVGWAEAKIIQSVDKETRSKVLMQNNTQADLYWCNNDSRSCCLNYCLTNCCYLQIRIFRYENAIQK